MPKTYPDAVQHVARVTGAKPMPERAPDGRRFEGVVFFETVPDAGLDFVWDHRVPLQGAGAFLFLYDHGHGRRADVIGVMQASDKFDVIRRIGTDAANYGHDTAAVVSWLRDIDREDPLDVLGAGPDFVEGAFRTVVKNPSRVAREIHRFCPDFVDQGLALREAGEPHALIERYLSEERHFFFWWD